MTNYDILPKAPKEITSFKENVFIEENFDVDEFLQKHKKNATLEIMRDDLGLYMKILRSAMIDLINKDYADFVNLSGNLIGLDKSIEELQSPLGQLKEEVLLIQENLDKAITELSDEINLRHKIREKKRSLQSLAKVKVSMENLFSIINSQKRSLNSLDGSSNLNLDIIERAAMEYNQLKFHASRCRDYLKEEEGILDLEKSLLALLDIAFLRSISQKKPDEIQKILRVFKNLEKNAKAEEIMREKFLKEEIQDIVSERKLQNEQMGLLGIYNKLTKIYKERMKEIIEATSKSNRNAISGFDFLVNSFFVQVVNEIELNLKSIFAPGDPELFHKNFTQTLQFLLELETFAKSRGSFRGLKEHPEYHSFLKRWNLAVYFEIRNREIAGDFEMKLKIVKSNLGKMKFNLAANSGNSTDSTTEPEFSLETTKYLWQSLVKCYSDQIFLPHLLHRFWKLSLQLCSRYQIWCQEIIKMTWSEENKIDFLTTLFIDLKTLEENLPRLIEIALSKFSLKPSDVNILKETLGETITGFSRTKPLVGEEIVVELLNKSTPSLKSVADIPRIFRRTNREIPKKPSNYVANAVNFLVQFNATFGATDKVDSREWIRLALSKITQQYLSSVSEVLTSVQKTEESLRRLKQIREKTVRQPGANENQGVSDDEKIRIQIAVDVQNYAEIVSAFGFSTIEINCLDELKKVAEEATKVKQ